MAKTLKDFLEGYLKVKSADEQKFVDKHVTAKIPDRNGNGDDVFKGSTKVIDRRKERKGYNPGEDEKVYEELKGKQKKLDKNHNGKLDAEDFKKLRKEESEVVEEEQIDELSKKTLGSYIKKASNSMAQSHAEVEKARHDRNAAHSIDHATLGTPSNVRQQVKDIIANDSSKREKKHFKDVIKRHTGINRATDKLTKEEAEQIDELSKGTLSSYVKKAADDNTYSVADAGSLHRARKDTKLEKRRAGISRAVDKLAKEEVEAIDEKISAKSPMGTYIKDFEKSDAPQFKGKSPAKRRVMAIAAKLTAERGGKPLRKEERLIDRLGSISESHQRVMLEVFEKLNEDNKTKFMESCTSPEGVDQMLDFAIRHRGE